MAAITMTTKPTMYTMLFINYLFGGAAAGGGGTN
jgi:hypothetical protein